MFRSRVFIALVALCSLLVVPTITAASPASASSVVMEAENAALSGGAVVASDHTGYAGTGFVAGYTDMNKGTADTAFTVNESTAGNVGLALRYANGTTATMTLSLYVNGTKFKQIALPATADWNTWATENENVTLNAGANTVAYKFDTTDSGNVNLDNLTVTTASPPPPGQYEAENAALSGGAVVASDHTGYTGTGFVAGYTDTNKGSASTTFTVSASAAGTAPVALRYANGTTATMTLSLYVNGAKIKQISLPATADWNTWTTENENVSLNAGTDTIAYKFDASDSGNVNLDNIVVGPVTTPPPPPSGQLYQAGTAFYAGGPSLATAISGYHGNGYLTGFTAQGARVVIEAEAPSAGANTVTLQYANTTGSPQTVSLYLNGLKQSQLSLPAGTGWRTAAQNLTLRTGLNLIGYQTDAGDSGNVSIDSVTVSGGTAFATSGATLPYVEYRAADAQTNGTVLAANRRYPSIQAESTGRQAVVLNNTGQYVQFALTQPANAIALRYSIPANADGSTATSQLSLYANGAKIRDLPLTTQYSWLYGGGYYDTRSPSSGPAHHFYDEIRAVIGNYPAGTVLTLQKDSGDNASSYTIDVLDAEQLDGAYSMPPNFVSVTDYGVTPNSGADDTNAVNNALAALSNTGKGLWLPPGTYDISGRINLNNVALRGSGQWYSTIQATAVDGAGGLFSTGGAVQIADLNILGDQTSRNNDSGAAGIEGSFGPGSLIFNVLIEHEKVGLWINPGDGLYVAGLRVRDVFADGVHFHGGTTGSRVDQTEVRNTGDDQFALDSEGGVVTNTTVAHNTSQSPIQAGGIGVYGGAGNSILNNTVSDTVAFGGGIKLGTDFGPGFSGPTTVSGNVLTRAGSFNSNWNSALGALWVYAKNYDITQPITFSGNTIDASSYQGLLLSFGKQISNLTLTADTFAGAGTWGIDISNVTGSMSASDVTVSGTASGGLNNPGGYTINRGPGDSGF
jgi:hypothetical protein